MKKNPFYGPAQERLSLDLNYFGKHHQGFFCWGWEKKCSALYDVSRSTTYLYVFTMYLRLEYCCLAHVVW